MSHVIKDKGFRNQDIIETLQSRTDIEEELCSQIEQLDTLCAVQLTLAMEGLSFSAADFLHYSQVLKNYSTKINNLVAQVHHD